MNKPQDFDQVQAFTGFTPLEIGGHILIIQKVEEAKSQAGRDILKIYIDTDKSDKQPSYYMDQWKNSDKPNKLWPNNAIVRPLIYDADGNTNRKFKTFIEMVEKSNPGFKVQWGNNFAACFKGKLVGGVFAREEYLDNSTGTSKFTVKHQYFVSVDDVKRGIEPPKDKLLNPGNNNNSFNSNEDLTVVDDGDMPF